MKYIPIFLKYFPKGVCMIEIILDFYVGEMAESVGG